MLVILAADNTRGQFLRAVDCDVCISVLYLIEHGLLVWISCVPQRKDLSGEYTLLYRVPAQGR